MLTGMALLTEELMKRMSLVRQLKLMYLRSQGLNEADISKLKREQPREWILLKADFEVWFDQNISQFVWWR